MASKADEIIKLRNEGMAYGYQIFKKYGEEEFEKQVKMRGLLKVTMKFTPEEVMETVTTISKRTYNLMLAICYTALHDGFGFGKERLTKFRKLVEEKSYVADRPDPLGRYYVTFEDYANEANKLYDFQIDTEILKEVQKLHEGNNRKYIAVDALVKTLLENGRNDVAEELAKLTKEPDRRPRCKKERQKAECRQISDRHNKFYMDSNEEESIEYWFNIFALALVQHCDFSSEGIVNIWRAADAINGQIADGTETLNSIKDKLIDTAGIQCEFTKGGVDYGEIA